MPTRVIAVLSWQPGGEHCSQAGLAERPEPHWIPLSERLCMTSLGGAAGWLLDGPSGLRP